MTTQDWIERRNQVVDRIGEPEFRRLQTARLATVPAVAINGRLLARIDREIVEEQERR